MTVSRKNACLAATAVVLLQQGATAFVTPFTAGGNAAVRAGAQQLSMATVAPAKTKEEIKAQKAEEERIRKYYTPPEKYADKPHTLPKSEYLIGEEMVSDDESASLLADRCIEEAERLFASDQGWQKVMEQDGIFVEHKDIHGPYAASGVKVVRGLGMIDADADTFYDYQVSREGFQCIDEYLENHRNVDRHEWTTHPELKKDEDYELMTNRVEWAYPAQTREFVALDVIDRKRKILISKSALHPDRPGGSRYQTDVPLDETEYVRAVQYYASKVEPLSDGKCLLRMVTWGEMCDSYSAFWINKFNAHVFITPKYDRFRRAMGGEKVFELSNIVENAWQLPKLFGLKPDTSPSASTSEFVTKMKAKAMESEAKKEEKKA